jgi:phospholipid/cholesterol/gamma-HCH transport system permease protein
LTAVSGSHGANGAVVATLARGGVWALDALGLIGSLAQLGWTALRSLGRSLLRVQPLRARAIVAQMLEAGNRSLPLVGLISALIGMILALQSAYQLRQFGATTLIADLVAISVTRELAPLLAAIVVAGRVGSAIAAELGTMRVSEEIDALTVMGIDPVSFLVVPRVLGLLLTLPCLTAFSDVLGILGGFAVASLGLGLAPFPYLRASLDALVLEDIFGGLLKAACFALVVALVGCQRGLSVRGGPEQVGRATTSAVVTSILLVIVVDLGVTAVLYVR